MSHQDITLLIRFPAGDTTIGKDFHRRNFHSDFQLRGQKLSDGRANYTSTFQYEKSSRLSNSEVDDLSRGRVGRI